VITGEQSKEQRAAINQHHIAAINEHFRGAESRVKKKTSDLPLAGRLAITFWRHEEGLIPDLRRRLKFRDAKRKNSTAALDEMKLMWMTMRRSSPRVNLRRCSGYYQWPAHGGDEGGRPPFQRHELIVAEVLQSAEAMKAAVCVLGKLHGEKSDSTKARFCWRPSRAMCMTSAKTSSRSFPRTTASTFINLGIKGRRRPDQGLSRAPARRHRPVGLLVKSAQQMVITRADLKNAGSPCRCWSAAAALSDKFTRAGSRRATNASWCIAKTQ